MIWVQWKMIVFVYFPLFVWVMLYLNVYSLVKEIKREYIYTPDKLSFIEMLVSILNSLVVSFIPLYNLTMLVSMFQRTSWKESAIVHLMNEGRLKERDK